MTHPPFHTHASIASPHGFFTAQGGVSEGIYASLNCGPGSDDAVDAVTENRRRVAEAMGFEASQLCTLYQIHSADCLVVDTPINRQEAPKADAMVTNQPNVLLGILTADCTPILFEDAKAGVVGAAHAGWKGAVGGVIENTIQVMESLGASREHIAAVIGPCIAQDSYEVTEEFLEPFLEQHKDNERFFAHSEKIHFDLPAYVMHRLQQSGLQHVENLAIDTYPEQNQCFSNRRRTHKSEPDYGRQVSVIGIK